MSGMDQYFYAAYFVVTTMTTVGYGDLSGYTTTERIYCIILMIFGVLCFTFVSGALSSIMSSVD